MVIPVSTSFDVEGHRTSKILTLEPSFAFDGRGGSKKNRVAMSELINDSRPRSVVGRHLHFSPISDRKANKMLSHFCRIHDVGRATSRWFQRKDCPHAFSLCFKLGKTTELQSRFPEAGFQTTNEPRSRDDLPCSEVKQSNPIAPIIVRTSRNTNDLPPCD